MTWYLRWTRSGREIQIQTIPWVSQHLGGSTVWHRAVYSYYLNLYHIFLTNSSATTIITRCLGKKATSAKRWELKQCYIIFWEMVSSGLCQKILQLFKTMAMTSQCMKSEAVIQYAMNLKMARKIHITKNIQWGCLRDFGLVWALFRYYVGFSCHWRHLWYYGRNGIS